ncbi:MAG: hypothetical protein E7049_03650 [Lentisphaerae bacterium]|nr:hypothetical protein [Lentisphaerota bacterium]
MSIATFKQSKRLTAPICKFALSLCAALGIASVTQAADNVWEGDDDGYWSTDANWSNPSGDYWVINGNATSKAVKFKSNPTLGYTLAIVTDGVTFSGDSASDGLVQTAGDVRLGAWANGALTISSGTHVLNELAVSSAWWDNTGPVDGTLTVSGGSLTVNTTTWVGSGNAANAAGSDGTINVSGGSVTFVGTPTLGCVAGATGTLNINDGTATASTIVQGAGTGYVTFNGGTLSAAGAGTLIDAGLTVTLNAGGGTIATDYDVTVVPAMTGAGSLTKTGSGILTLSAMPTFSGTITVAADAGSVILPSGATIAAGTYTATRTVENGVEYYSNPPLTITQDDIAGDSIVLANDTTLNVTANANFGNLTVSGPYTLTLAGSSAITATSLNIAAGTTVQLASGTTLADGRIVTTSVTGAGVIGYTGVNPDSSVGYDNSAAWTGTVWIQGLTGLADWTTASYGNASSTLRLSGVQAYFAKGTTNTVAFELEDGSYGYGLDLNNGYGNGAAYNTIMTLKGGGTFKTTSAGKNEVVRIVDYSGFTGTFNLTQKIVVLGDSDGSVSEDYRSRQNSSTTYPGVGTVVIPEGKTLSIASDKTWSLSTGFAGAGTLRYTYPWQVGTGSLSNGDYWTGTVELAACVNNGTGSVAVYPGRMGGANSKIVFKGLAPGSSKGYFLNGSTSATIQLDGDVTISDGTSDATYSLGVLTGTGSFTGATSLGTACTFAFSAVSNYTGTISANSKSLVTIGTYVSDTDVAVGTKLVSVDSNNAYVTLNSVTVTGGEPQKVATAAQSGDDGFGVYVTAFQRDVYWVGGANGNWGTASNWALADGTVLEASPSDSTQYAGDNVIFTNDAAVVADSRPVITKMTLNADVTLSTTDAFAANTYSGKNYLFVETIEGEGTLTLSNAVIAAIGSGRPFKIYTPVCVADGTRNSFGCSTFVNYLYGNLSGSGYLEVRNGNYGGLYLYGDNSEFSGEFDSSETTRCTSAFYAGNATSSKAIWKLRGTDQTINHVAFITDSSTYYFGALLDGTLLQSVYNRPTLEVGARDDVASKADLRGRGRDTKGNDYYFNITKVGTNVFTVVNGNSSFKNNIGNVLIEGGTLALPGVPNYATYITFAGEGATLQPTAEGLDFSGLIKNSTSAIIIDDSLGGSATWNTALDSSNKGGLIKDGYGTLTLTKVPQYSGATIVKDGKLVVPFGTAMSTLELGDNATVEVDMTDAAANATAFSVGKIVGDKTKVSLVNNTSGVEFTLVETANGFVYVNGSKSYTWVGQTGDSNWSTAANWGQETDIPTSADTVTIPGSKEVYIDTAAAALAITANGDLTIIGPSNAKTTLAATSLVVEGNLTVSNNVELAIGAMNVSGKITMTQSNIDSDSYADNLGDANVGNMDIKNGFSGSGILINNGTLELTGNESFIGSIGGGQSVTKKGDDTYMLIGNNTFTGGLAIEKGTLMLGTPRDVDNVIYDFDASDRNNFTFSSEADDAYPTEWKSSVGDRVFKYSSTASATLPLITTAYFGGNSSLYLGSNSSYTQFYLDSAGYVPKTLFVVYREVEMTDYATLWGESSHNGYCIGRRNGSGNNFWVKRQNSKTDGQTWGLYQNGVATATAYVGSDQVFCAANADRCARTDKVQVLSVGNDTGRAFRGAYGEVIGYSDDINHAERKAIEAYLMAKWNVGSATYNVIPANADVTMKSGATLDMGGLTQTVKSFTGAGTVANGSLKTTGDFVITGNATIEAVAGQTYILPANHGATVTFTGTAKGWSVKVPDGARTVAQFAVAKSFTVGREEDGEFDVTVIGAPAKWTISIKDTDDYKVYKYGHIPFLIKLR